MSIQVLDIFKLGGQESATGKLLVLHYYLQGGILLTNELVYFDNMDLLVDFLRKKVAIEKYLYDDKEYAISHRHINPDTLHQTTKETFVFFNRDQYEYVKSRIIGV